MKTREELRGVLEEVMREQERFVVPARGFSMGRDFAGVEGFVLRGAAHARPRLGSIVVFKQAERWVAHRVILILRNKGSPAYLTRGDANPMFDHPWATQSDLLGVAEGTVSGGNQRAFGLAGHLLGGWRWVQGFCLLAWRYALKRTRQAGGLPDGRA